MKIQYIDTDGIKGSLPEGYLGYDKATADRGRVAVGTNTGDMLLAKKSEVDSHTNSTNNPHAVTKTQVGLGNVDNTSDLNKPISTATQIALDSKANQSTTYTKTEVNNALALKAPLESPTFTGTPKIGTDSITSISTAVTDNAVARYDGTTGKLQNSSIVVDDSGNVGIRTNPIAGSGSFQLPNVDSLGFQGPYGYIWANVKYTDRYRYATSAAATAFDMHGGDFFWKIAPTGTADNPITWPNTMQLDTNGNLLLRAGTGALGYGTGAGGQVTQLTSNKANVTLNKPSGKIFIHNSIMLANTTVGFKLNNSLVTDKDTVILSLASGAYAPYLFNIWGYILNGAISIYIKNISSSDVSQPIVINFAIIRGATV